MDEQPIALAQETISHDQLRATAEWMVSGARLTKGPETIGFETEFAEFIGSRHAVFVNSGSSANLMMVLALLESGHLRNRIAICPAISWVTTVSPLMLMGFDVHLCDAEPSGLGLDPVHLRELMQRYDAAVVVTVDVLGHGNLYGEISKICDDAGAFLIEDSCEALGTIDRDGRMLGTRGLMGSFSFYYGHHMSTIEGGMVVTDDDELHQILLAMRSHGWSRDLSPAHREQLVSRWSVDRFSDVYTFYYPGLNLRSTDVQARIGRMQLKDMPRSIERREALFHRYRGALPQYWSQESGAAQLSAFAFGTTVGDRSAAGAALDLARIESRPLICGNIGRHPFWLKRRAAQPLPVADLIHHNGMYLPLHPGMSDDDVDRVAATLLSATGPGPDPRELVRS